MTPLNYFTVYIRVTQGSHDDPGALKKVGEFVSKLTFFNEIRGDIIFFVHDL